MNTQDAIASMKEPVDLVDLKPGSPLATKIVLMMAEVSHIPKTGHNSVQKYDYATEADTVAACRKALIKHGVSLIPSLKEKSYTPIVSKQGANGFLVSVTMTYTLTDAESGESATFHFPGDGMDYGDKGIYKAMTGAEKYALLKLLHLPTGDDPEKDSHEPIVPGAFETVQATAKAPAYTPTANVPPEGNQAPSARVPWTVPSTEWNKKSGIQGKGAPELADTQLAYFLKYYQGKIDKDPQSRYREEWEGAILDIEEEIAKRTDSLVLR